MVELNSDKNISGYKMIFLFIGLLLICVGVVGFIWCAFTLNNDNKLIEEEEENEL